MQPCEATWADIEPGCYVSAGGVTYKVVAIDTLEERITFVDREGRQMTAKTREPWTPVTLLGPTMGEAVAAVQNVLGGQVLTIETE